MKVHPYNAVRYTAPAGADVSDLVAPPYDVLDASAKQALLGRSSKNVVAIDLPHIPPKTLGPAEAYKGAASAFEAWLADGTLTRHDEPVMFVYRQSFDFAGTHYERTGMACTVEVRPFGPRAGGGMLAHEQTFSGPKEDRFALMKATKCQLSPIFGLHADEQGSGVRICVDIAATRPADFSATLDGVKSEAWIVADQAQINAYADALAGEDVFVADGHHRYTTAINYLADLESNGDVPADHPARRCMVVLVSMSDPGLAIGPTHRVLGGMSGYSLDAFTAACEGKLELSPVPGGLESIERAVAERSSDHPTVLGLYDYTTRQAFTCAPVEADPLAGGFADKPEAWRRLDVAVVQHLIVEGICEPALNGGEAVKWAFPHSIDEVRQIGEGRELGSGGGAGFVPQLGVTVRPTPLAGVRAVSRANELMPQKSTFFYPKLATGMFLNPLA